MITNNFLFEWAHPLKLAGSVGCIYSNKNVSNQDTKHSTTSPLLSPPCCSSGVFCRVSWLYNVAPLSDTTDPLWNCPWWVLLRIVVHSSFVLLDCKCRSIVAEPTIGGRLCFLFIYLFIYSFFISGFSLKEGRLWVCNGLLLRLHWCCSFCLLRGKGVAPHSAVNLTLTAFSPASCNFWRKGIQSLDEHVWMCETEAGEEISTHQHLMWSCSRRRSVFRGVTFFSCSRPLWKVGTCNNTLGKHMARMLASWKGLALFIEDSHWLFRFTSRVRNTRRQRAGRLFGRNIKCVGMRCE